MSKEPNTSDVQQTIPLLPSINSEMNGLNVLRTINSIYVKQNPSLTESKFVYQKIK